MHKHLGSKRGVDICHTSTVKLHPGIRGSLVDLEPENSRPPNLVNVPRLFLIFLGQTIPYTRKCNNY
ncbi:MAG: hypothetical protein ACFCD0_27635 [Gemmataceae bacterium]